MRGGLRRGFTLVELLVVISIIGMLSTLAVVSLQSARSKARDARRVGDMRQIATALELYYNDQLGYPVGQATLGVSPSECLGGGGFDTLNGCTSVYMGLIPTNPGPGGAPYVYNSGDGSTYTITFAHEGKVGDIATGAHTLGPGGVQ